MKLLHYVPKKKLVTLRRPISSCAIAAATHLIVEDEACRCALGPAPAFSPRRLLRRGIRFLLPCSASE